MTTPVKRKRVNLAVGRALGARDAGRRALALLFSQMTGALLFSFTVLVYIINLPAQWQYLHKMYRGARASSAAVNPAFASTLTSLGVTEDRFVTFAMALMALTAVTSFLVGGLILWRRVEDRIAFLAATMLLSVGIVGPMILTDASGPLAPDWPWRPLTQGVIMLAMLSFALFFMLFPTGTFVPRWMRWLLIPLGLLTVMYGLLPGVLFTPPLLLPRSILIVCLMVCLAYSQVYRYRRTSNAVQRQQTKWISLGVLVGLTAYAVDNLAPWLFAPLRLTPAEIALIFTPILTCCHLLGPIYVGMAITRWRLWSIDVIIRRTLIYGSLTGVLAALYFSVVVLAQLVTQRLTSHATQEPIVIVGTTLLIAVLITPLRRRIQAQIDRAFYRGRYDAIVTLADFGAKLRTETDLEDLRADLVEIVQQTMRPAYVTLWLAQRGQQVAGADARAPLLRETGLQPTPTSMASSKSGG
jgi:hypothetical protein